MNFLDLICHRKPERSFFIYGHQFPVCARCTGFYTTLIIFLIVTAFYPIYIDFTLFLVGILLLIPCAIDGFTQYFGLRESNNILRLFTGLLGGLGLIFVIEFILYEIFLFLNLPVF